MTFRVSLTIGVLVLSAACGGREEPQPAPAPPPAATYVGGGTCAPCHQAETAAWETSHHARAMQPAAADIVAGAFDGRRVTGPGTSSVPRREGERFVVRTEGPDGAPADFQVTHTFGITPLQQYLVALPRGRLQALRVAWDARPAAAGGQRWLHLYPRERIDADDPLHWTGPAQNWNYMCAECHSTNLRKGYDAAADAFETTWTDMSVSCEACHGPASRHVAWAGAGAAREGDALAGFDVAQRARPGTWDFAGGAAIAARSTPRESAAEVEACGRCHARRAPIWPEHVPGRPLADAYRVDLLDEGLYYADGQQQDEVYEYGSFLQSRMHAAGVTCSDCHEPHAGTLRTEGNTLCAGCHRAEVYDAPAHHFHEGGGEAARCVSCHMPERLYMVVDGRRDHRFGIPRPDQSDAIGTPNACTGCHAQRPAAWAAAAVARWYPRSTRRGPHFAQALHAGRTGASDAARRLAALAGDASQPAIARATAVSLLAGSPGADAERALAAAVHDADPLVRRAAATTLGAADPVTRSRYAADLLADASRSVRLEAVLAVAGLPRQSLTVTQQQALDRAVEEFRAAQAFNADRAEAWLNLGILESQLGRAAEAEQAWRAALARDARFVPAWINLADLFRAQGRDADAERLVRDGLAEAPDAAALHHALGLALVRSGRRTEALASLERAAALAPSDARYAFVHAVAVHDAGSPREARRLLAAFQAAHPGDRDVLGALVSWSLEANDRAAAARWARALAEAAPDDPRAQQIARELGAR